jgi:hypothetical protein
MSSGLAGRRSAVARHLQYGAAMLNKTDELKNRIDAKRHELSARLSELKADTRHEAAEARDKIKARLDEVEQYLKDGWDRVTDSVKSKLNEWLDRN